jgi:hypothetical protein
MYDPSTMAPIGRMRKPAPNVVSESMSEANSLPVGKNVAAIAVA